jgi:hypothetical protein
MLRKMRALCPALWCDLHEWQLVDERTRCKHCGEPYIKAPWWTRGLVWVVVRKVGYYRCERARRRFHRQFEERCRCCRARFRSVLDPRWQLSVQQPDGLYYAIRPLCEACFEGLSRSLAESRPAAHERIDVVTTNGDLVPWHRAYRRTAS